MPVLQIVTVAWWQHQRAAALLLSLLHAGLWPACAVDRPRNQMASCFVSCAYTWSCELPCCAPIAAGAWLSVLLVDKQGAVGLADAADRARALRPGNPLLPAYINCAA
jgi:hypothetical protein